jgi:hypothetical protein
VTVRLLAAVVALAAGVAAVVVVALLLSSAPGPQAPQSNNPGAISGIMPLSRSSLPGPQ